MAKLSINPAGNLDSYCKSGNSNSLRKQIFDILESDGHTNPLLAPKQICQLLDLSYKKYRNYVSKTKWEWKYYHRNERGSKCSLFHCFKAKVAGFGLRRGEGCCVAEGDLGVGCWLGRASLRIVFGFGGAELGRVVWFETGLVGLHVRRPGNLGRLSSCSVMPLLTLVC